MTISNVRKWCEETADTFNSKLVKKGKQWVVVQKGTDKEAFRSEYLSEVQKYFLNQIMKYLGKRMGVRKK